MKDFKFRIYYQHGETGRITNRIIELGQPIPDLGEHWHVIGKCQCTDLRDINGKEIYENDIVTANIYADDISLCTVKYDANFCAFIIEYRDSEVDYFLIGEFPGTIEIVGNIYENIELKEAVNI